MNATFQIGEVAILQNCNHPELNGQEVTITSALAEQCAFDPKLGLRRMAPCYRTDLTLANGRRVCALPHQLRKKRPPQSDTGEIRVMQLFDVTPIVQPVPEVA